MKIKLIFAFAVSLIFVSCKQGPQAGEPTISPSVINIPATASGKPAVAGSAPVMTFAEEKHDFGKITQGEVVTYAFSFRNDGGSDLVISSAQGSCGCTIPSFPKVAIKPGQVEKIDVKFDSAGKSGLVQKTVTLVTNCTPSTKVLTISATINVPEEE
ncbi:MAG: DUF1573 domain-containing protein [Bacteroidetes bacterium]|nr:DUF1573 domain-containing protein [Bacteroidota bacterium]